MELPRDRLSGRLRFDAIQKAPIIKERKVYPKRSFCETIVQMFILSVEVTAFIVDDQKNLYEGVIYPRETRRTRGATERSVEWSSKVWIQI